MSLQSQLSDFIVRLGTELKLMKTQYTGNNAGLLTGLTTTDKTSLLAAVNEIKTEVGTKKDGFAYTAENAANKGAASGYASLDSGGQVPMAQLPAIVSKNKGFFATTAALATAFPAGTSGDYAIIGATDTVWLWDADTAAWVETDKKGAVVSVNGMTGAVTIPESTTLVAGLMSAADDVKLVGIAAGATANQTDVVLKARANHTGTQTASTISDWAAATLGVLLAGLSTATASAIAVSDSILVALGKLQAQINAHHGTGGATHPDSVAAGASGFMSGADKSKLNGIAASATANATDASLRDRATHTGTQSADTITDGAANKAFLAAERTKLAGIAASATVNDTDANLKARANHTGTQLASTISDWAAATLAVLLSGITFATNAAVVATDSVVSAIGKLQAQINAHHGAGGATHPVVISGSTNGFMSGADKAKLDGIAASANNYAHPVTDGNIHLPVNGTTNLNKVPKATAAAGVWSLDFVSFAELAAKPVTIVGYGINDAFTKTEIGDVTTNFVTAFNAALV